MFPSEDIKANRALIVPREAIPKKIEGKEVEVEKSIKTAPKISW